MWVYPGVRSTVAERGNRGSSVVLASFWFFLSPPGLSALLFLSRAKCREQYASECGAASRPGLQVASVMALAQRLFWNGTGCRQLPPFPPPIKLWRLALSNKARSQTWSGSRSKLLPEPTSEEDGDFSPASLPTRHILSVFSGNPLPIPSHPIPSRGCHT